MHHLHLTKQMIRAVNLSSRVFSETRFDHEERIIRRHYGAKQTHGSIEHVL